MPSENNTPAIRFAGFTGEWEKRKLGDLADVTTGKLDANAMTRDGEYDFYTCSLQVYKTDQYAFEGPAITVAGNGYVGCLHLADGKFNAYQRTYVLSNFGAIREYLYEELGNKLPAKVNQEARSGNIPYIVRDMLTELQVLIPNNEEQRYVARLFQFLDTLITLHRRKCELLETLKKSMLEKLFPKEGELVPALRFAGFTGEWERRKLEEVTLRFDNLRVPVSANERISGSTPYYGANGIQDYVEGYTHDGEFILIAEDGANDVTNYPVNYVKGRIWVNNHAHVLQARKDIADNIYLSFAIGRANIECLLVGGGRSKLNTSALMEIIISKPIKQEQEKIGFFLYSLDTILTLHRRKLEHLQNIKKACLEKMFI